MRLVPMPCDAEIHDTADTGGTLMLGTVAGRREALLSTYRGQVQTIYLDPPFNTGKRFFLKQRCGDAGWQTGEPFVMLPAYEDRWPDDQSYLAALREAAEVAHALLSDEGSLFFHIDARMHAPVRLMLDDVFGRKNFTNEIIWAYQSGGRSKRYFSRKHDTILFYRKTPQSYFNIAAVGQPRAKSRTNHMRRGVDEDGRPYRAIVSQGKEYRYYDDDPSFPGDVWDDVSHLQQKDPQRTGYDNQKPVRLLERIVLATSKPGDLVCDLFAGSGTAAVAAATHGRRFLMLDCAETAMAVSRKRLIGRTLRVDAPCACGTPEVLGEAQSGLGLLEVRLLGYALEEGLCPLALSGIEAVDQISAGYLRGREFHAFASAVRDRQTPGLPDHLAIPVLDGRPAVLTVDVLGRRMVHAF